VEREGGWARARRAGAQGQRGVGNNSQLVAWVY